MNMASNSQVEIPYSQLTDLEVIGAGGFGVVSRAKHARFGTVVYKELDAKKLGDRAEAELKKEARMHILQHINIVALYAIIFEIGHYGLVMEYVLHGSLEDFVFNYDVDWPLKLSFAHGIVCGMKYLHSLQPPVIHSDLKLLNVLVSERFTAKICDFGLAKWKQHAATQTTTKTRRGTPAYMAPEVHNDPGVPRATKYDVYSFGILLWELLSGEKPYEYAVTDEQIKAAVVQGNRPPLDAVKGNADLVSFAQWCIHRCWHESPDERPTFDNLERLFSEIRQVKAANPVCRPFLRQPKLAWTAHMIDKVCGVAVLDNIMYVVCAESSTIRLYNTDTHSPLDLVINVDGMKQPWDIVVCRDDRRLYVADWPHSIWRVSVDDHSYVKWLSTKPTSRLSRIFATTGEFDVDALSVTSRRLLVTPWRWSRRLRQYSTTDRQLLRVVELPQYVWCVYHGVETTRGTFVVSHRGTSQDERQAVVSEVDVSGRLLRTFTDVAWPPHLSLDSEGHVLVADWGSHRILLLNSELQLQRVLIDNTDSQVKLWWPAQLCYDELTSRLYVAHSSSGSDVVSVLSLR